MQYKMNFTKIKLILKTYCKNNDKIYFELLDV